MYKEHEDLTPPSSNATLWRYMDFTKFVSLLDKKALFFARANKLEDPFEGYLPFLTRAGIWHSLGDTPYREDQYQSVIANTRSSRQFTLISCWHKNADESAAMWKLYSKDGSGIAIKTDFASFSNSFTCDDPIRIGEISYVDYEPGVGVSYNSMFSPFLYKRKSFEHEHEVRAIVLKPPLRDNEDGPGQVLDETQDISDYGEYFDVDLSLLIQEVLVSPYTPDWLLELVRSVAMRYGLNVPVVKSSLVDEPMWD